MESCCGADVVGWGDRGAGWAGAGRRSGRLVESSGAGSTGSGVGGREWARRWVAIACGGCVWLALGGDVRAQEPAEGVAVDVGVGETRRLAGGSVRLARVRMEDGATLVFGGPAGEDTVVAIEEFVGNGMTTIRLEGDVEGGHGLGENIFHVWLLDGGSGISGRLTIDASGRRGDMFELLSGRREGGQPVVVSVLVRDGGVGVMSLRERGRWLRIVSRGSDGRLLGGHGGVVLIRMVWGEPFGLVSSVGWRERQFEGDEWSTIAAQLGVEVDVGSGTATDVAERCQEFMDGRVGFGRLVMGCLGCSDEAALPGLFLGLDPYADRIRRLVERLDPEFGWMRLNGWRLGLVTPVQCQ